MNKTELVKTIAEKAGIAQTVAGEALNATVEAIVEALVSGDAVTVPGLGTFKVSERAARTARNPQTGATVEVPASKSASFKVAKAVKDKLN